MPLFKGIMDTQICNTCKIEKPLSEFYRDKAKKLGVCGKCKECSRIYAQLNREKLNRQKRERYAKDPEKYKEACKKWKINNPKKAKDVAQETYHKYRDKNIKYMRKRYAENNEYYRKLRRDSNERNKEKIKIIDKERYYNNIEENRQKARERSQINGTKPVLYSVYGHQLTIEESPTERSDGILLTQCAVCKKYFAPNRHAVKLRVKALKGQKGGECKLYCSDECKEKCDTFNSINTYKHNRKPNASRAVQAELRQMCLDRDNHECQICGNNKNLVCHHYEGVELNPIESADLDNTITLCTRCHQKKVHTGYCSGANLRCA